MYYVFIQSGKTALMKACQYGHKEIINFLIEREADVNIQDKVIA